jgi:mono/diheme cytochrome c family protein
MRVVPLSAAVLFALAPHANGKDEDRPYTDWVRPFLEKHCQECHGAEKPKGEFRIDRLAPDFDTPAVRDRWLTVLQRVRAGEMPPKGKPRPPEKDVEALAAWVTAKVGSAAERRAVGGRVVLRRLNRVEYENTVRDLLGIEIELKELLPPDAAMNGFDNNADAQHVSSFLMERYLEAADAALNVAIANGPRPPLVKKRYSLKDERLVKTTTENVYRKLDDALVMFSSSAWNAITVGQFYPPDRGRYRIRISATGFQCSSKPVTYRIDAGPMLMGTKNHLVDYFDAAPDKATVAEFVDHFEARNHIRISPYGLAGAQTVNKVGADKYEGPGLSVQWVEVEGPLHETWPPESHRRIFGDLAQKPAPVFNNSKRVEVVSADPEPDARRILRGFARRAFRRAVTDADVEPFVALVNAKLAQKRSFEQAVRAGLQAVMMSPEFLFLREQVAAVSRAAPGPAPSGGKVGPARLAGPTLLDDFALASRLSYFLWSTMPDEELLGLAEKGKLATPDALRAEVERMLQHPKAAAFTGNFVDQWLDLKDIDFTSPDLRLYPEFDEMLKEAMVQEARLFFDELLKKDLSLTNFVASDFTMLNERLAKHYGVPGVEGLRFRKVMLPPGSHRGGVLTMAGALKVTANGTTTSPVVRGAWVLNRILGTPPAPPPSGVPAVEPDIRGATTIRQQLAKHRADAACASCHARIDPPGFALESFDVIGGWRDYYRSVGNGKPVTVGGRRMPYLQGKRVDPADVLPDGRAFQDIDELKKLLLADKDQLARALAGHLLTYATGAPPGPSDKPALEAIVRAVRAKDYGFRALVHAVVASEPFRHK